MNKSCTYESLPKRVILTAVCAAVVLFRIIIWYSIGRMLVLWRDTRMRGATAQSRSFAYVGPSSWNLLPHELRLELLSLSLPLFRKRLKTILFVRALGRERL